MYPFVVWLLVLYGQQPLDILVLEFVERAILSYGLPCPHHLCSQMSVLEFLHPVLVIVTDVALFTILRLVNQVEGRTPWSWLCSKG